MPSALTLIGSRLRLRAPPCRYYKTYIKPKEPSISIPCHTSTTVSGEEMRERCVNRSNSAVVAVVGSTFPPFPPEVGLGVSDSEPPRMRVFHCVILCYKESTGLTCDKSNYSICQCMNTFKLCNFT